MISFNMAYLFTCIPTMEGTEIMKTRPDQDPTLPERTSCSQILQNPSSAVGSPASPVGTDLYVDVEGGENDLTSVPGVATSHCFRYMDFPRVKLKTQDIVDFTGCINAVDRSI